MAGEVLMVTPTLYPARARRRFRTVLTVVGIGVAVAVIAACAGALWFYTAARGALPQLDGTIAVAGLSAPVKVVRDAQGVPHISAANLPDLLFAQGYVTAQDRLWQMDLLRRNGAGEMAEVFGPSLLQHDQQELILGPRSASAP